MRSGIGRVWWPILEDSRTEVDTNTVERVIRTKTLTRKNALLAGSNGGARHRASVMRLIQTAALNSVERLAWLMDVLERIVSGRMKACELNTLLPWNWQPYAELGESVVMHAIDV